MSSLGRKREHQHLHNTPTTHAPTRTRIAGVFILILAVLITALLLAGAAVGREVGVL